MCALFLGGCATTSYEVKVRALPSPSASKPATYRFFRAAVAPGNEALDEETMRTLRSALATKGLREVPAGAEPDLVISFSCGVMLASVRQTMLSEPIYYYVPGPIRYETVQVGTTPTGSPIYQTVTRQDPPTQQFYGYRSVPSETRYFRKILRLRMLENNGTPKDLATAEAWANAWGGDASYESEDKNLSKVLPVLAAASMVYFGKDSSGIVPIRIKDTDSDVVAIKRGR
ncbi:MAG: DUF4136 domain-containing protein [Verrucomicrobia bacterium]|nr:DUF4136 domain-containing protein [Verrucomicrobiota bacterium]